MKIAYLVNEDGKKQSDATENHIIRALKAEGCEVHAIPEQSAKVVLDANYDALLFHKGGPLIHQVLPKFKGKKVMWYFDKVWHSRIEWMKKIIPLIDLGFLTDATWLLQNSNPKLQVLRQGIGGRDLSPGKKLDFYDAKIVFTGSIYGTRADWVAGLFDRYRSDFKMYTAFGRALFDLCASVPILVAPIHPSDDHYWSSRLYITLGSGGFLIHPYCADIAQEYEDGKHYISYKTNDELFQKIDYFLAHEDERETIRQAGMKYTQEHYTYHHRVKELLTYL